MVPRMASRGLLSLETLGRGFGCLREDLTPPCAPESPAGTGGQTENEAAWSQAVVVRV